MHLLPSTFEWGRRGQGGMNYTKYNMRTAGRPTVVLTYCSSGVVCMIVTSLIDHQERENYIWWSRCLAGNAY